MSSVQEGAEGSPRSEYNAQRQYIEQNIAEKFLELPLRVAVMTLVKKFDLETVQEAFEYVESEPEDVQSVPETQKNVANLEEEAIEVHSSADLPTSTPLNTGVNSPCNNSVSNLVRSRSNEDITRESREFEFRAGPSNAPYPAPFSEPVYKSTRSLNGEAAPPLDAKILESIFDGSDMKPSFEQMQGYSETMSVKSFQTHDTTIKELNFAENMLHTMGSVPMNPISVSWCCFHREKALFKQKVAIVVLNPVDGRLLVTFLKKEGFQAARIKE